MVSHDHHKCAPHGSVHLLDWSAMEVPFGCDIRYSKDHCCAEYFMRPKCIKQEIVEHDDASIAFACHLCEYFSCGFVF